jgi:branched-chain amino acid transport system permease protein
VTFSSILIQLLNGLAAASSLFLVSAGLSLIFGVTRIVNFAHGSLYMLGLYIAYSLIEALGRTPTGFWSSVILAALAAGVVGVAIEVLILRRIYRAPELFQLLATFAVVLVIKDIALYAWGSEDLVGPRAPGLSGALEILGKRIPVYDLLLIAIGPLVLLAMLLLLGRTRWGALVRAATQDREMVGALGVDQAKLFTSVFSSDRCWPASAGRCKSRASPPISTSISPSSPTLSSLPWWAGWGVWAAPSSPRS